MFIVYVYTCKDDIDAMYIYIYINTSILFLHQYAQFTSLWCPRWVVVHPFDALVIAHGILGMVRVGAPRNGAVEGHIRELYRKSIGPLGKV
jgi:hypothetical protein